MKKKAHELEFISQIKRDGSGTSPVEESYVEFMVKSNYQYDLHCLSITQKTYIAFNFNVFVVKLKSK